MNKQILFPKAAGEAGVWETHKVNIYRVLDRQVFHAPWQGCTRS
ncbi:MAG: hypothetical protein AAFR30_06205 [Cyanobacteria bacterium J06628_4]